jgi:hypothetical protein
VETACCHGRCNVNDRAFAVLPHGCSCLYLQLLLVSV